MTAHQGCWKVIHHYLRPLSKSILRVHIMTQPKSKASRKQPAFPQQTEDVIEEYDICFSSEVNQRRWTWPAIFVTH